MLTYNKKFNVWHIPNSGHLNVLSKGELSAFDKMECKDKVFMDIGACAGIVSKMALERGASKVICVEPDPINVEVIKLNVPSATIVQKAVVKDGTTDKIEFYRATSGNLGIGSALMVKGPNKHKRMEPIMVDTIGFNELLDEYRPSVVKMDIEGSEFDVINGPLPDYVEEFHCEFHILMRDERILKWWKCFCHKWFYPQYWINIVPPVWVVGRNFGVYSGMNVNRMAWRRRDLSTVKKYKVRKRNADTQTLSIL